MIKLACEHPSPVKNGKTKSGKTRLRCKDCGKSWTEEKNPLGTLRTDIDKAAMALSMICEGCSIRSVSRITGLDKATITRIVVLVGKNALAYCERTFVELNCYDVQVDEVWGFTGCKQKIAKHKKKGPEFGDQYMFTAIDRESKLLACWDFGKRDMDTACGFMRKLRMTVAGTIHLSTDGFPSFYQAVKRAFGADGVHYGQIVKIIQTQYSERAASRRYSPGSIKEVRKAGVFGHPTLKQSAPAISKTGIFSFVWGADA